MRKASKLLEARTLVVFAATMALGYLAASSSINSQVAAAKEKNTALIAQAGEGDKNPPAPDFTLPSLSGKNVSLSGLRGKWVFVNFWATWCGPCVLEMPMMNKLYKELKNEPFEMLAVSIDDLPAEKVGKFASEMNLDFTILLDRKNTTGALYGIVSIPLTFVIDPNGRIVSKANGMREWDSPEVVQYFKDLIRKGPGPGGGSA